MLRIDHDTLDRARLSVASLAMEGGVAAALPEFRDAHPQFHPDVVDEDRLTDQIDRSGFPF